MLSRLGDPNARKPICVTLCGMVILVNRFASNASSSMISVLSFNYSLNFTQIMVYNGNMQVKTESNPMYESRQRYAGVLLHITSLPGPYGIGDLGNDARAFADFLADAGVSLWQILPLGPTGYGNSPYAARSSFACNELLISPDILVTEGFLKEEETAQLRETMAQAKNEKGNSFGANRVDYGFVESNKLPLLKKAVDPNKNHSIDINTASMAIFHMAFATFVIVCSSCLHVSISSGQTPMSKGCQSFEYSHPIRTQPML